MESTLKKELILIEPTVSNYAIRLLMLSVLKRNIPVSLFTISALTPPGYKIRIFANKLLWPKKDFTRGALVGISCITSNAPQAYKLAARYREAGAYVVMGGPHVSALPEEALQYCNSVVIGEAESVWGQVIRDFESKSLQKIYRGQPLEDFFSPVYDYFKNLDPRVLMMTGIQIVRGCKYHCDFCVCPSNFVRYVKVEQVTEIIKTVKESFGNKSITMHFPSDNIFSDPQYAKEFFKALILLKIKWVSQSSIDIAFDEEALSLAKQSGCKYLFIGFETIYPEKLQKTSVGNIHSTADYVKAIKKIKSYKIGVVGAFIIGFDYYSHLDYLRLLFFLISTFVRSRFFWISVTILTPFPGTQLFERLKREGRISTYDWGKYDLLFHAVFRPKNMSPFSLALWFVLIRIIAVFCSTLGIAVFLIFNFPHLFRYFCIHILPYLYYIYMNISINQAR